MRRSSMLARLVRERRQLTDDPEAFAAAGRGIARLSTRLGWHYEAIGMRWRAIGAYLRGLREAGDLYLACRVAGVFLPERVRARMRKVTGWRDPLFTSVSLLSTPPANVHDH